MTNSKAGLFSAVLTTFNVQSYVLLQPKATPDPSIAILQQISAQLGSFSISHPFVNSTQPPNSNVTDTDGSSPIPRWAIWLNGLWFSGLILSLASASLGILVKQWLNEYGSGLHGTSLPVARLRQYRLENLRTWHVQEVVSAIPLLLQLALACFLAGLLILLWTLHPTVAAIASALVGLLAVFTVVTAILPLFFHRCSYLLPQIRRLDSALWRPKRFLHQWIGTTPISVLCGVVSEVLDAARTSHSTLSSLDPRLHHLFVRLIKQATFWTTGSVFGFLECVTRAPRSWGGRKQTWQGRERSDIRGDPKSDNLTNWNIRVLLEAYSTTLRSDVLVSAAICLTGTDYHYGVLLDYFKQLHNSVLIHFGSADADPLRLVNQNQLLWLQIILSDLVYQKEHPQEVPILSSEDVITLCNYFDNGYWSPNMGTRDTQWAISTIDSIVEHLQDAGVETERYPIQEKLRKTRNFLLRKTMQRHTPSEDISPPADISTRGPKVPLENMLLKGVIVAQKSRT